MEDIKPIIDRLNQFFQNHTFEVVVQPTHDENYNVKTNVKVEITGMKDYIRIGDWTTFIQYTLYILKTDEVSDKWYSIYGNVYGTDVPIKTTDNSYHQLRWVMDQKLEEFLKIFSINHPTICTRVINEVEPMKLNESENTTNQLNDLAKLLVEDIIKVINENKFGEFSLPEYFGDENRMVYTQYPIDGFTLDLDLEISEDVKNFEVDGDLYYDDDLIYVNVVVNPNLDKDYIIELRGELIETIRHELEHINQIINGMIMTDEPKEPEMYYSQEKEIGAQKAGFKLKSEEKNMNFEGLVREWFDKYQHKHSLNPEQQERVIQKILDDK
jgi:hypothetical protein